jgi:hypothetical protein
VQNINIVYRVDASQVERSNAAVQQARDLTDKLKNSAKSFGDQGTKSGKQFHGTIEAVRVRMAQLRSQIELTNRSDTKRMNDLIRQYQQAKKEVDDFNKKLVASNQNNTKSINDSAGAFMNLYNAIKLVVGAAVVREFVDMTLNAASLAGQVDAVGRAFNRQIPQAELVLFNLRKATKGTVSDLELMQRALKFQNFGGNVEALPQLLEFASVRAQQTGQSIDYMVNSIVDGIGRKSIRVLDNLGLSASTIKEELGGISMEAATVAQVSEAMGRVAARELEKMGGFAENSATMVDQLKNSWVSLKEEAAKAFTELGGGFLVETLKDYVDTFKDLFEIYNRNISASELYAERLRKEQAATTVNEFSKSVLNKSKEENIQLIDDEIARMTSLLGEYSKEKQAHDNLIKSYTEMLLARQGNQYQIEEAIDIQKRFFAEKEKDAALDQEILKLLIAKRQAMKDENDQQEAQLRTIKVMREELAALQKLREEGTSIFNQQELDELLRKINILEDEIQRVADPFAWEQYFSSLSKASNKAFDEMIEKSKDASKAIKELQEQFDFDIEKVGKFDFSDIEVEAEVQPAFKLDNEKWVRFRLELKQWFSENSQELAMEGIDFSSSLLQNIYNLEVDHYAARLDNVRTYYGQLQDLAGNNDRFRKELQIKEQRETAKIQREMAIKQKQARIFSIIVDTAAAIAKAWVNPGYPGAIPLSIFLAAQGAAQAAVVNRAPMGFKDGVIDLKGPGTATSDSIPANLSRGESVMTAKETQTSKNTLRMIRAKQLDDNVVARLAARAKGGDSTTFDDSRLAKIMQQVAKNTQNSDIIRKGSTIYDAKKESDTLTKYIRSKNIN